MQEHLPSGVRLSLFLGAVVASLALIVEGSALAVKPLTDATLLRSGSIMRNRMPTQAWTGKSQAWTERTRSRVRLSVRNSEALTTHLEIHLRRRQVLVYQGDRPVRRYPIGIGRPGWETPTGSFQVQQMKRNPVWINPFTNETISSRDPRNPLQGYWIGFWTDGNNWIGFHGTLDARTVGRAASYGCIHMYQSDLEELFTQVSLGTPVRVVP